MTNSPTAAVLIIGNEILSGRTVDANLNFLAVQLGKKGILLREARVVPDIREEIVTAVNALRTRYSYVFTTGGIGPTHDDITAACVAEAFGQPVEQNAGAVACLQEYYDGIGEKLNEIRLRMANMPVGARILKNSVTGAPGFNIGNVYVLPGIPRVLQGIFLNMVDSLEGGAPVISRAWGSFLKESQIAVAFEDIQHDFPDLDLGSYPTLREGRPYTTLVAKGTDAAAVEAAASRISAMIAELGEVPQPEKVD